MTNKHRDDDTNFYHWMEREHEELFDLFCDDTIIVEDSDGRNYESGEEVDHHWLWQIRPPTLGEMQSQTSTKHDLALCHAILWYLELQMELQKET